MECNFDECFDAKPLLPSVSMLEPDTHNRVAKALITQIIYLLTASPCSCSPKLLLKILGF